MKRWLTLTFLGMVCLSTGCVRETPSGVTELVYATPYSPAHPFSRADLRWMAFVEQQSRGSLRIKPSWSGALLSAEHSMLELRHGVVDIGLITPIYVKGGAHLIRIQSGFYSGIDSIENQVALFRCIASAEPQIARELEGLVVLAVQGGSTPGVITRDRPIRSLNDLRGLRIRVPTELLAVLRNLGADPVNMPMGEVYSALAKGVIDGVVAPEDTFRSLHLAEVARHFVQIAIPRGAYPARAMGQRRWDALSPEHRAILEAGIPVWEKALAEENRRALDEGRELARKEGVVETRVSEADQTRFDQLYARDAGRNAEDLARYGIDGSRVLDRAQASVGMYGRVNCLSRSEQR
ncbi:MAG: TRAP transporter substrate-binding protein DctP [Steroidobacteraceae bacterium]